MYFWKPVELTLVPENSPSAERRHWLPYTPVRTWQEPSRCSAVVFTGSWLPILGERSSVFSVSSGWWNSSGMKVLTSGWSTSSILGWCVTWVLVPSKSLPSGNYRGYLPQHPRLIACSADNPLADALSLMSNEGLSSVAVIDQSRNVVGNISTVDVRHLTNAASLPLLQNTCLHFISVVLNERGVEKGRDSFPVFYVNPYSTLAHTGKCLLFLTNSSSAWADGMAFSGKAGGNQESQNVGSWIGVAFALSACYTTARANGIGSKYDVQFADFPRHWKPFPCGNKFANSGSSNVRPVNRSGDTDGYLESLCKDLGFESFRSKRTTSSQATQFQQLTAPVNRCITVKPRPPTLNRSCTV